jgi:hypothetical protein
LISDGLEKAESNLDYFKEIYKLLPPKGPSGPITGWVGLAMACLLIGNVPLYDGRRHIVL